MARQLVDRRERLFGREADLARLLARTRSRGLTAVVARPQMGKSWLLTELARRLAEEQDPPHLLGFAESMGQTPDLLLRAVVDLYGRWLADAGYRQQAKMVWDQQKSNLLPGVARAVGRIFEEAPDLAKPVTVVVDEAINGLLAANQTLTTGGIQLPSLTYDQARDLIAAVGQVGQRPITLVLDQWEKSPDPKLEARTLDGFLRHLEEWPRCHILLALRPDEPAHAEVARLVQSLPGTAEIRRLREMALETEERARLGGYVRTQVPAAREQDDEALLGLIGGYPGVLYQWTSDYQRAHMQGRDDLARIADDAQHNRFSELSDLLPGLTGDRRRLAIRVALLPQSEQTWPILRKEWLGDLSEDPIDDLALERILESRDPPSFGHAKRWEAALVWVLEHRRAAARSELEDLIARLAAPVKDVDARVFLHVEALWSLLLPARALGASDVSIAAC